MYDCAEPHIDRGHRTVDLVRLTRSDQRRSVDAPAYIAGSRRERISRPTGPHRQNRSFAIRSRCEVPIRAAVALRVPLEDGRGTHAAPDAHAHHAVLNIALDHFVQQRRRQLRSGASKRVAESDGTTVDIDN